MKAPASTDRAFGLLFAAVFGLLGLAPLRHGAAPHAGLLLSALLAGGTALLRPGVLAPFNRLWTRLGLRLHALLSPVVMSVIFFAVVTPIALLMRLLGQRPLSLAFEPARPSYWIDRIPPGPDPASMEQQF